MGPYALRTSALARAAATGGGPAETSTYELYVVGHSMSNTTAEDRSRGGSNGEGGGEQGNEDERRRGLDGFGKRQWRGFERTTRANVGLLLLR